MLRAVTGQFMYMCPTDSTSNSLFPRRFLIQLLGTNKMATAVIHLLDSLNVKTELLEIPLPIHTEAEKKLKETIVPNRNCNLAIQHFPEWAKQLSVTWHIKVQEVQEVRKRRGW